MLGVAWQVSAAVLAASRDEDAVTVEQLSSPCTVSVKVSGDCNALRGRPRIGFRPSKVVPLPAAEASQAAQPQQWYASH